MILAPSYGGQSRPVNYVSAVAVVFLIPIVNRNLIETFYWSGVNYGVVEFLGVIRCLRAAANSQRPAESSDPRECGISAQVTRISGLYPIFIIRAC